MDCDGGGFVTERRGRGRRGHGDLARRILEQVRARGMQPGDHLAEQRFADLCGVSRTPIRSAFKLLESNGVLSWAPDVGYSLAVSPDVSQAAAFNLPDSFERQLADRILADRTGRRIGESVSVSALMRRLKVSRQSVLLALKILQSENVISQTPNQAWSFRPILDTGNAVGDSIDFRLILEPAAILAAGFVLDRQRAHILRKEAEAFLGAAESAGALAEFQRLDVEIHSLIAASSGNRFLRDCLLPHHRLRQLPGGTAAVTGFRLKQSMQEHIDILESLDAKQFEVAADLMRLHLRQSRIRRPSAVNRGSPALMTVMGSARP